VDKGRLPSPNQPTSSDRKTREERLGLFPRQVASPCSVKCIEGRLIPPSGTCVQSSMDGVVESSSEPAWAPSGRLPCRAAPRADAADFKRANRIGEFWSYPQSRAFAQLLIDCEEDRTLRTALVMMLREAG
jgi:hypothetical protein